MLMPLTLGVIVKPRVELYRGPLGGQEFNIFGNLRRGPEEASPEGAGTVAGLNMALIQRTRGAA